MGAAKDKYGPFLLSFGRDVPHFWVTADTPEELLAAADLADVNPLGLDLVYIHWNDGSAKGTGLWDNQTGWDEAAKARAFSNS